MYSIRLNQQAQISNSKSYQLGTKRVYYYHHIAVVLVLLLMLTQRCSIVFINVLFLKRLQIWINVVFYVQQKHNWHIIYCQNTVFPIIYDMLLIYIGLYK